MTKKEEIKEEIWQIWQILLIAKECHSYSFYLHKPDTKEESDYLQHSRDFNFIRHMLWRMTVIELSKLFRNSPQNDRFNLFHFISKLKKGGHFGKLGISENKIEEWESKMTDNTQTISEMLLLRDKLYSHTAPNKKKYIDGNLTFEKIEELIKIVESVIREIYSSVFDSHASIGTISFDRKRFKIIEILAEEKNKRKRELLELLKKK